MALMRSESMYGELVPKGTKRCRSERFRRQLHRVGSVYIARGRTARHERANWGVGALTGNNVEIYAQIFTDLGLSGPGKPTLAESQLL